MPAAQLEPVLHFLHAAARRTGQATLSDGQLLARFAAGGDQAAFAALVERHGRLVLGVCRRVLGDWHAAEDAFQATFLVLARKAGALAGCDPLGPWLHGVARRTAAKARAQAARRRAREARAGTPGEVGPDEGPVWRDLRAVLDEEVGRLPARHRAAVVLCYLQGRTNAEAASRLGCSRGTVATLLARARARLRQRLTRRGLALPAALAAVLARAAQAGDMPRVLLGSTVRAAVAFAAGENAAGLVSAQAASLAEGVTTTMLMKKWKFAVVTLLLVGLAGVGAGLACYRAGAEEPGAAQETPPAPRAEPAARAPRAATPAVYRTANFVVTAPTSKAAEQVGRMAERDRKAIALLWLGNELPAWPEPCPVEVQLAGRESSSATTFQFRDGAVAQQSMTLRGSLEHILDDLLPHEVTHAVLAHKFGRALPRWADEGAAMLSESAPAQARHARALRGNVERGRLAPLRRLLPAHEYPRDVAAFHAQSYGLVEFLVASGGRARLLAFVAQGERDGWNTAVRAHYKYRTVEELETAWLDSLRREGKAERPLPEGGGQVPAGSAEPKPSAVKVPQRRLPAGPAPVQALVLLEEDGRLTVWQARVTYVPKTVRVSPERAVTTYEQTSVLVPQTYGLGEVRASDSKGREVKASELRQRLPGETLALVATDGQPVDPLHLRLVRDGTLILVVPVRAAALAPAPPSAPAVVPPPQTAPPRQ
ncbi:MAG: sigma-70 family RNA polymerase sigma factor [Gemmataceae bacterium]|nr:sigma-70 family RNA polymerase sigma factor [Gemmataceae bacterium]